MRSGRTGRTVPPSVVLTMVLCVLITAAAVTTAATLRTRDAEADAAPTSSQQPTPSDGGIGPSGCLREGCQVLGTAVIGSARIELVAEADGRRGRLRIGGSASVPEVLETTITANPGATLTAGSLQCLPGAMSACLVSGRFLGGRAGQVFVYRSEHWNTLERPFVSDADYIALAQVLGDAAPEVVTLQHKCVGTTQDKCSASPVYARVFGFAGQELGCTKTYAKVESVPGWPNVTLTAAALRACG